MYDENRAGSLRFPFYNIVRRRLCLSIFEDTDVKIIMRLDDCPVRV